MEGTAPRKFAIGFLTQAPLPPLLPSLSPCPDDTISKVVTLREGWLENDDGGDSFSLPNTRYLGGRGEGKNPKKGH
jgi:hypothetical protein